MIRTAVVGIGHWGRTLVDAVQGNSDKLRFTAGHTRTPARAELVAWDGAYRVPDGTDIVVNATSVGLAPDTEARLGIDLDSLRPGMVVADVIPNPPRTWLIRDAEARGCTVLDGLGMLVNQAVIGIRFWTGVDPDPVVMRRTLEELFGS